MKLKPENFKEANIIFNKEAHPDKQMPAYKKSDNNGIIVSCWNIPFSERVKLLFTGKLWVGCMTLNNPFQPISLCTNKEDLITKK